MPFNLMIVGQAGRLAAEAVLFAASLRAVSPGLPLIVAEPQPGPLWPADPRMDEGHRALLADLGAEIRPFASQHFGAAYPYGNKIEGLAVLPPGEPFLFFDTDTLVLSDLAAVGFDFDRPAASMRRTATWPVEDAYWPGYEAVWRCLYDRFGLDSASSLDLSFPSENWQRYLYFNAGWFFGADPAAFRRLFLDYALSIRDDPPPELACQPLDPWLDQVALPLVIHALGGGRPGPTLDGLDGEVTCHYRALPLLYARESDRVVEVLEAAAAPNRRKKLLKTYKPLQKLVYQRHGARIRGLFDRGRLPPEPAIRKRLRAEGLWLL